MSGVQRSFGASHFMRLGGAQGNLGVGKDTFARRVEENIHRLLLGNGNRIFPVAYIGELVAYRESDEARMRMPVGQVALQYALTEESRDAVLQAEAEFAEATDAQLTVSPSGARFLSAAAIADLLGFSEVTVLGDWAKRPGLLPPAGSLIDPVGGMDTYFAQATFND